MPSFNRLHRNWHALGVLLVKWDAISFHPSFWVSFKCIKSKSSWASHDVGVLEKFFARLGDPPPGAGGLSAGGILKRFGGRY